MVYMVFSLNTARTHTKQLGNGIKSPIDPILVLHLWTSAVINVQGEVAKNIIIDLDSSSPVVENTDVTVIYSVSSRSFKLPTHVIRLTMSCRL